MSLIENLRSLPAGHPHTRMLTGKTPFFASTFDQRFSFCLYVPKGHKFNGPELPLVVIIHGTRRQTGKYLDGLKKFCDRQNCVVLCPLFPAGIVDPEDIHNYKTILYKDIRFDNVLLSMLEQAARIWRIRVDKFILHGFSGGGQFAHRFAYLYPDRLAAVSIGAPGRITPPDIQTLWPDGLANITALFGVPMPDFECLSRIPVQFVVGEEDTDTSQLASVKSSNRIELDAGTRVGRIQRLKADWEKIGISSELSVVPGVAHDGLKCLPAVEEWLARQIGLLR